MIHNTLELFYSAVRHGLTGVQHQNMAISDIKNSAVYWLAE